jgi:MFS family permease
MDFKHSLLLQQKHQFLHESFVMQLLKQLPLIPRTVWVLGFVSTFTDIASELVLIVLPFFMVGTLGIAMPTFGIIEGIAESSRLIMNLMSGILSDLWRGRKRKPFIVLGFSIAASAKVLFALARSTHAIIFARIIDRVGTGIRSAPRDALIADVCPAHLRGSCFGLRQTLDTVGAFTGPLLAMLLLALFHDSMHVVLAFAIIPAFISVLLLVFGVHETAQPQAATKEHDVNVHTITQMSPAFWRVASLTALIYLTRISEAFLLLNAHRLGMAIMLVPLVKVTMNIVFSLVAYPAGALSDRIPRIQMLCIGLIFLIVSMGTLALSKSLIMMFCGIIAWGIYMGINEGILNALVVDTTNPTQRGTAFGIFNTVAGVCILIANISAGIIWHAYGAPYVFGLLCIVSIAALAFAMLLFSWQKLTSHQ